MIVSLSQLALFSCGMCKIQSDFYEFPYEEGFEISNDLNIHSNTYLYYVYQLETVHRLGFSPLTSSDGLDIVVLWMYQER